MTDLLTEIDRGLRRVDRIEDPYPHVLRVLVVEEPHPTFPDEWGWEQQQIDEYMRQVDEGDIVVRALAVQRWCEPCFDWSNSCSRTMLPTLGDVHVPRSEVNEVGDVIRPSDIPLGPCWWGPGTPANAATSYTPSGLYLVQCAADLLAEARDILYPDV